MKLLGKELEWKIIVNCNFEHIKGMHSLYLLWINTEYLKKWSKDFNIFKTGKYLRYEIKDDLEKLGKGNI
jgi:hypothetical protein